MRTEICRAGPVYLIFVGIDHIDLRILIHRFCHLKKRTSFQYIIVIGKHNKISLCHSKCLICVFRNAAVLFQFPVTQPFIRCVMLFQKFPHRRIAASIRKAQLHIWIRLLQHRIHDLFQKRLRRVIKRDHHTEKRPVCKIFRSFLLRTRLLSVYHPVSDPQIVIRLKAFLFLFVQPYPAFQPAGRADLNTDFQFFPTVFSSVSRDFFFDILF